MTSKSPAIKGDSSSEVSRPEMRPYQILQKQLEMEASRAAQEVDPFELAAKAVDKITEAQTVEDIWAANDASGFESLDKSPHLFNIPLNVVSYRPIKGDPKFKSGLGYFAGFDAVDANGELHSVSCGAPQIVAMMAALDRADAWPQPVIFREKRTLNGFDRITMERVIE